MRSIVVVLLAALVFGAQGVLAEARLLEPGGGLPRLDYGDAPDGRATGYGPRGRFPSLRQSDGARSVDTGLAILGHDATRERNSRQVNNDPRDDGVLVPRLSPCRVGELGVVVGLPGAQLPAQGVAYVNAWFDWNRDGDWNDVDRRCGRRGAVPEWVVRNRPIDLSDQDALEELYRLRFRAGAFVGPMWFRVTLSVDQRLRAPRGTIERGEVEDYLLAREPQIQPYACFDTTVAHGKSGTLSIVPNAAGPTPRILSARLLLTPANTAERRIRPNPGNISPNGRRATFRYESKRQDARATPLVTETVRVLLRLRQGGRIVTRVVRCTVVVEHDPLPASDPGSDPGDGGGDSSGGSAATSKRVKNIVFTACIPETSQASLTVTVHIPADALNPVHRFLIPGTDTLLPRPICPGTVEGSEAVDVFPPGVPANGGLAPQPDQKAYRVSFTATGMPTGPPSTFDFEVSWTNP